ncbi:MAG: putative motility protein [Burkholderiales bacterium]|nr:putative motility protein [Burkholderiales bacterium]MDE2434456.1 putative motility protein [Burkholderiales bacterium]
MNIANSPAVSAVSSAQPSDGVQLLLLRKALQSQAQTAATMLQALPQQPKLATEGSIGTHINTYA